MPSKKKKYNARFPPARIKKIMQSDEDVGKVAQAVPVIISRALELFVESLLKKAEVVTQARNAKTLTPSHLKQCIMSEQRFDFLRDLVSSVSDVQGDEDSPELNTPRTGGSAGEPAFNFPSQSQGPSTSSAAAAATSSSSTLEQPQQHQSPEYMMSLQNPLQQHYIKKEDVTATKTEQGPATYAPLPATSSSQVGPAMTRSHQYAAVIAHPHLQQQPSPLNNNPYIPSSAGIHPHQQQLQPPPNFYYSQYNNSNGNVKVQGIVQANDMNRHYGGSDEHAGQHPGYDYTAETQRHHY